MRHACVYRRYCEAPAQRLYGFKAAYPLALHGYILLFKERLPHVHPYGGDDAIFYGHLRQHYARRRFYPHGVRPRKPPLVCKLCEAAYAVSAHLGGAAVAVEKEHAQISFLRGHYHHQPVCPYAGAPAAEPACIIRGGKIFFFHGLYHYEIVAQAMHLSEPHDTPSFDGMNCIPYQLYPQCRPLAMPAMMDANVNKPGL